MFGKLVSMSTNDLEESTVSFFREEGLFYPENEGNNSSKLQVPIYQTKWCHIYQKHTSIITTTRNSNPILHCIPLNMD
jgi:hypothetical protein